MKRPRVSGVRCHALFYFATPRRGPALRRLVPIGPLMRMRRTVTPQFAPDRRVVAAQATADLAVRKIAELQMINDIALFKRNMAVGQGGVLLVVRVVGSIQDYR